MTDEKDLEGVPNSFNNILPRNVFGASMERDDKEGTISNDNSSMSSMFANAGSGSDIYRTAARRFYDPELTITAIYLPKQIRQKNRWRRWFYDHDEIVGAVLDLHAELPYSKAEVIVDDPVIHRHIEECLDTTNFFSKLPSIDLEYLKIGEVFVHNTWNADKGMWDHIVIHNPDYIEVKYSPFADQEAIIELLPDEELKSIIHSTKPEEQRLKRRLPQNVVKRVLTGKNIILDSDEITHIARRSNPTDVRGTSILDRLFRCHVSGTFVRISDGSKKVIEDVNIGDFVLSKEGEKRKILDKVEYEIADDIIKLSLNKSQIITATKGHKFLVRRKVCSCGCGAILSTEQVRKNRIILKEHLNILLNKGNSSYKTNLKIESTYEIVKIPIEDIKPYDYLLVPKSKEEVLNENSLLNEDTSRLIGYYLSEGCFTQSYDNGIEYQRLYFSFNLNEKDTWVKDVITIIKNNFGIEPSITKDGVNGLKINVSKKEYVSKIRSFIKTYTDGDYSYSKKFKEIVMTLPKNLQKQILIGAFRGDGHACKKHLSEFRITTVSKILAEQYQWLLYRNNIYNKISVIKSKITFVIDRFCNSRTAYTIRINSAYATNFIKECWGLKNNIIKDSIIYDKIIELKNLGHSNRKIAKYINESSDFKNVRNGIFYNKTVSKIIKNDGYNVSSYRFNGEGVIDDEDYFYVPVKKIETFPYVGKVYDITVDVNHWWLADGSFVNSNTLILEDKYREAQLTISDNFVYPLKLFKLGDKNKGWIPNKSHQRELAKMLQQANFDPNFALIYHYGLEVEYITGADKVFQLSKEWEEINNRKFIALGVSKELITTGGSFASANVGLQTQLARYRAKRDLFEELWIRDKFFRVMAERNGWYRRDAKEIVGQYRVSRSKDEMKKRLILPQLDWNKKLMMRDDQSYLTFLNNVFAQGRGPLSAITLLMAMGVDLEDELRRKTKQEELEKRYGMKITPTPPPGGGGIGGTGAPPIMASTKFIDRFKFGKKVKIQEEPKKEVRNEIVDNTFTGYAETSDIKYVTVSEEDELRDSLEISKILRPASTEVWFNNLRSSRVSSETVVLLNNFKNKLDVIDKKYEGDIVIGVKENMSDLQKNLVDIYMQGKMSSYSNVNNIPLYDVYYSRDAEVRDFSDLVLVNEFEDWVKNASSLENVDKEIKINIIRDIANTCFSYGQLKGYQEQGIYNVKVGNVLSREGFRYDVEDLLKKGSNLGSVLSPSGEIIVFSACITGFDKGGNNISPEFVRFKSFNNNGISVKDCPIEYKESIDRLLNRFGKFIKKEFDSFIFVDDVTALDSWEREETKRISANFTDKDDRDEFIISANIQQERLKKRGKLPIFIDNRTVHLSNWIGVEDGSLNEKLINCLNLEEMESLKKAISKSFSSINFDLTEDELKTYRVFGYIDPIADENSEVIGWTVNEYRIKSAEVNGKLADGKVWDVSGKCLKEQITDPFQIFRENVVKYIDFPHKLSESLRESFNKLA